LIIVLALLSVLTGGALAYAADRFPGYMKLLDSAAGLLLLAGLALLGASLAHQLYCC
jgi:hypothetical protein